MTLKEKIDDALFYIEPKESITKCVQIAEEFAIGFTEWSVARALGCDVFDLNKDELEIYKKEKQL